MLSVRHAPEKGKGYSRIGGEGVVRIKRVSEIRKQTDYPILTRST